MTGDGARDYTVSSQPKIKTDFWVGTKIGYTIPNLVAFVVNVFRYQVCTNFETQSEAGGVLWRKVAKHGRSLLSERSTTKLQERKALILWIVTAVSIITISNSVSEITLPVALLIAHCLALGGKQLPFKFSLKTIKLTQNSDRTLD